MSARSDDPTRSAVAGAEFRRVMGHLPTGVTLLTALTDAGPVGMAANSVTSVSLEPPMVLFCPGKSSETWPAMRATGRFCINVVSRHGVEVTRRFARKGADRFTGVRWHPRAAGPALDDAVAWIECTIREEHDAGDHAIVVADVVGIDAAPEAEPLVFFRGDYGAFTSDVSRA